MTKESLFFGFAILAVVVFFVWAISDVYKDKEACEALGGVTVSNDCIDKSVVIEVP